MMHDHEFFKNVLEGSEIFLELDDCTMVGPYQQIMTEQNMDEISFKWEIKAEWPIRYSTKMRAY